MSTLVGFIREFQQLALPASAPAAELFERMLQALLDAEGPPADPIAGVSTEVRTEIARSRTGRPLFLCHTWDTGPWTCILIDIPPVVMGRPVFLPNPAGRGLPRVVTDYRSQKFQRRVGLACQALKVHPPQLCRIVAHLHLSRLFLAWAPVVTPPPALSGDLDNYAKNVMDALQRSRLIANDSTIASIGFARVFLPLPTETLDDRLLAQLLEVQSANPKLNRRALAKKAGISQRTVKRLLDLAKLRALAPSNPATAAKHPSPETITPLAAFRPLESNAPAPIGEAGTDSHQPITIPLPASALPQSVTPDLGAPIQKDRRKRSRPNRQRRSARTNRRGAITSYAPAASTPISPTSTLAADTTSET